MGTGYISGVRFGRVLNVPIALPQTEIRRGKTLKIATVEIGAGQSFEVRSLTSNLLNLLTSGAVPHLHNKALGYASVGIYSSPMVCSSGALLTMSSPGVATLNPFVPRVFAAPGIYDVVVSNNTSNIDMTVVVSGSIKMSV